MLRLSAILSVLLASAASAQTGATEERCAVMVQAGARVTTTFVPGFAVSGVSSPLHLPTGYSSAKGILCQRSTLAIGDSDYHVITDLSLPLSIASGDRVIVLEISDGQFRVRTIKGDLTQAETEAVQSAVNRAQSIIQGERQ